MRLEQRLGQSLEIKQTMTQEQRLEMKQEMVLTMANGLEDMRNGVVGKPEELLGKVIGDVLKDIRDPKLRQGLERTFEDEVLLKKMTAHAAKLSLRNEATIRELVAGYIYESMQGNFEVGTVSAQGELDSKKIGIPSGVFAEALINQEGLEEEVKKLTELLRSGVGVTEATSGHISEAKNALRAAEPFRDYAKMLESGMDFILSTKQGKDSKLPKVQDFLRELVIIKKLDYLLAERTQKRFATRAMKISSKDTEESYKNAFMNTASEFVLTSMGVIDPGVFRLNKAELDEEAMDNIRKEMASDGLDLDKILKHYALSSEGTIFWNRWSTLEQRPGKITDNRIREFVTQTVRADEGELLQILNYPEFFETVKELVTNAGRRVEERKDLEVELGRLLGDLFENKEVRERLRTLIKERWYPKITTFYREGTEKNN